MVNQIAGNLTGKNRSFSVVISRFNQLVSGHLLEGVKDCLLRHGVSESDVTVYWVPGSFEIAQAAGKAARTDVDGVICVGALIRGDTPHFDVLAHQVVKSIHDVSVRADKPVAFGVITADTQEQALERAGSKAGNKGWQAALSALEMVDLWDRIQGQL